LDSVRRGSQTRCAAPSWSSIERLRRHVQSVRPSDRAEWGVDLGLRKHGRILERLENATPFTIDKADVAHEAVLEGQAQGVFVDYLDARDMSNLLQKEC
jgi:hypothetical protein